MPSIPIVQPLVDCLNPKIQWPSIHLPGLPSFAFSLVLGMLGGIGLVLDFLPLDPLKLPKLPGLDLFIKAALPGIKIGLPEFNIGAELGLPNIKVGPIPGLDLGIDLSGAIKLFKLFIYLPFLIFEFIIKGMLQLKLALPTLPAIQLMIEGIGLKLGIDFSILKLLVGCLGTAVFAMLTAFIPI